MTKSDSSIDGCEPGTYLPVDASEFACARALSCACASLYLSSLPPQILMHDDWSAREYEKVSAKAPLRSSLLISFR